eukprot:9837418-Alexandrium_andersonii.AAC.1
MLLGRALASGALHAQPRTRYGRSTRGCAAAYGSLVRACCSCSPDAALFPVRCAAAPRMSWAAAR